MNKLLTSICLFSLLLSPLSRAGTSSAPGKQPSICSRFFPGAKAKPTLAEKARGILKQALPAPVPGAIDIYGSRAMNWIDAGEMSPWAPANYRNYWPTGEIPMASHDVIKAALFNAYKSDAPAAVSLRERLGLPEYVKLTIDGFIRKTGSAPKADELFKTQFSVYGKIRMPKSDGRALDQATVISFEVETMGERNPPQKPATISKFLLGEDAEAVIKQIKAMNENPTHSRIVLPDLMDMFNDKLHFSALSKNERLSPEPVATISLKRAQDHSSREVKMISINAYNENRASESIQETEKLLRSNIMGLSAYDVRNLQDIVANRLKAKPLDLDPSMAKWRGIEVSMDEVRLAGIKRLMNDLGEIPMNCFDAILKIGDRWGSPALHELKIELSEGKVPIYYALDRFFKKVKNQEYIWIGELRATRLAMALDVRPDKEILTAVLLGDDKAADKLPSLREEMTPLQYQNALDFIEIARRVPNRVPLKPGQEIAGPRRF
jgi:hypothetical protein